MNKAESAIKRLSIQSFARKTRQIMLTTISILLARVLILVCVLLAYSPGRPEPFLDENKKPLVGSIPEKVSCSNSFMKRPILLSCHCGWSDSACACSLFR